MITSTRIADISSLRFVVVAPIQNAFQSNGIFSLVYLTKVLRDLGHESLICISLGYEPHDLLLSVSKLEKVSSMDKVAASMLIRINAQTELYNLRLVDPENFTDTRTTIVIYPETITSNPLKASNVVRYFGNKNGILTGDKVIEKTSEFIISHSRMLGVNAAHVLFFPFQHPAFEHSNAIPVYARPFDLTYIGKGNLFQDTCLVKPNSVEVTRSWPSDKYQLALLMKNCRFFYTYDSWSNINVEAVLCGAIPVLLGSDPWTDDEIDQSELGVIPRIRKGVKTIDPEMFNDFELRRNQLISRIIALQTDYPGSVKEMVEKMKIFFNFS